MKKIRLITVAVLVLMIIMTLTCCGKIQRDVVSAEAAIAYVAVLEDIDLDGRHAYAVLEDVNGDEKAELILEVNSSFVDVYTYDDEAEEAIKLYGRTLGKLYEGWAYYSNERNQVIFPSASTGGESYYVVEFSGNNSKLVKSLRRINSDHSESGVEEYLINGKNVEIQDYEAASEILTEGFVSVETEVETILESLRTIAETYTTEPETTEPDVPETDTAVE
ncbi:MAG: hypothetical protein IJN68_03000 [Clostridia bacterium]|nr:hypothetical protein [Clostridia bacterium]